MIDMEKYAQFVDGVTSRPSKSLDEFVHVVTELNNRHDGAKFNVPQLLTAMIGLTSEAGEAQEIVKKILFQGKPFTEETREHLKKELGDVIWYWANACNALDISPNEVIAQNVSKLEARYPGGKFDPFYSENRKEGDV